MQEWKCNKVAIEFCGKLLDELPDALIVADLKGVIQIWNKKAESMFKIKKVDAIDKSLDIIIPVHLRNAHWAGFHRAISADNTRLHGEPVRTKALLGDGSTTFVDMAFSLTHDEDGHLVGVTAIARLAASIN